MGLTTPRWKRALSKESFPSARKRAAQLPSPELLSAADAHLYYTGTCLNQWRRGQGIPALEEAQKNIWALLEITRELQQRSSN